MGGIRKIEFAGSSVERASYDRGQPKWAVRLVVGKREGVVERREQPGSVTDILKFMQEMVNMTRHPAGGVPMSDAIRQNDARNIIAARKNCREVTALIPACRLRNHIALQPRKLQRTMRPFVTCPQ